MFVYVNSINKRQEKLALDIISHCYKELIDGHEVDILVSVKSNLDENMDGWCQRISTTDYEIEVERNLNDECFIKTLCHEMVHVKQGVKGELANGATWRGKTYSNEQPWEVEAYRLEVELYYSFLQKR